MPQPNDLSRSLVALNQDDTLIAVIEMSRSSWLVAGIVPGIARHPLKKLMADEAALLQLLERWRSEAIQAGRQITRIAVALVVSNDGERGLSEGRSEPEDVVSKHIQGVDSEALRFAGEVVTALVGHQDPKASPRKRHDLLSPAIPELREPMQQDHERTLMRPSRNGVQHDPICGEVHVLQTAHIHRHPEPLRSGVPRKPPKVISALAAAKVRRRTGATVLTS